MTREENMFVKRLQDLSRRAFQRNIVTFSDFLNLNEQNIFHTCSPALYGGFQMYGGYDYAERQMIAFLPDALIFQPQFPMVCLKVQPINKKFADELSHRDVLGSLMSLGIERGKVGDILCKEQQIYVFCSTSVSFFLMEELTRIRHTSVTVCVAEEGNALQIHPNTQLCEGIITSNRLDALVAELCRISRSSASGLIKKGNVFINGKEAVSISSPCKPGEMISIRGIGRFRFLQASGETKKGRLKIQYDKYT